MEELRVPGVSDNTNRDAIRRTEIKRVEEIITKDLAGKPFTLGSLIYEYTEKPTDIELEEEEIKEICKDAIRNLIATGKLNRVSAKDPADLPESQVYCYARPRKESEQDNDQTR